MKSVLIGMLLSFALTLAGCGSNDDDPNPLTVLDDSIQQNPGAVDDAPTDVVDSTDATADQSPTNAPDFQPPTNIFGTTYLLNIDEGTGLFASSGSFLMRFSANQNTYERITISGVSNDASGSYSYLTSGTQGIATIDDSVLGRATIGLNFSSTRSGSYVVTVESDSESIQSGSFEQQGDTDESADAPVTTSTGVSNAGSQQDDEPNSSDESSPDGDGNDNGENTFQVWQRADGFNSSNILFVTNFPAFPDELTAFFFVAEQQCYVGRIDFVEDFLISSWEISSSGDLLAVSDGNAVAFTVSGVSINDILGGRCETE